MLKLKKLQLLGFKSFCDRTELKFPGDGIAAIVGPNGCGKSNIADAISWVLGEQSAKSLRGIHMQDVIFAGTRDRKPTGMAEVSLTLIDPEQYEGKIVEPEIEIRDEMPDDWDEAAAREASMEEVDEYTAEVQPGTNTEAEATEQQAAPSEGAAPTTEATAPSTENEAAPSEVAEGQPSDAQAAVINPNAVVLKIRRRKFNTNRFKKGEICVTRRLFRSGDSEYLLNGKLSRLRDVHDIFMGTGLGPESYAIIEQGRIGQILSSKPTDRRAIIEEAAGITKYKTKKRLAEARLEDAKSNLARVNDIFDEVTRQMNSLKRQAAKAERYAKLRDEMREKLRVVLASKFALIDAEIAGLEAELTTVTEEIATRTDAVQQMDNEHGERVQRGYAIDAEAKQNRESLNNVSREMDRAAQRRRTNEERCAELVARSAGAEAEIQNTTEQLGRLEEELATNRQVLESAAADVAVAQSDLQTKQQEASAAAANLMNVEREQEQRRSQIFQAVNAASNVRNRITQAEERIANLDREHGRVTGELSSATLQLESFGGQRGQLGLEFESANTRVNALSSEITDARGSLQQKRQEEIEAKRHVDTLRAEYATLLGKKGSLESVINEHGYSTESVKRLFQSGGLREGNTPAGVLADFLEVEDKYEHVVEDFLRDELNYVVVKSWGAADEGLRLLKGDVDGRATFLVHPSDSQAKFSFVLDESMRLPFTPDRVTPMKNCIRVLNGFGKSLEVVLPKLGNGYIVPDPAIGRELALENPDAFFLSQSGECFHNVTVTGGKQRSQGPLSLKRELRDVMRCIDDVERSLRDGEARVLMLGKEIAELTSLLQRLEDEKREGEKQAMTSGHTLRQLENEMARVRDRHATYERELQRVSNEKSERENAIGGLRMELEAAEARHQELEAAMNAATQSLDELRTARDNASHAASEARAQAAALEERHRAAASSLQRIESMVQEVSARIGKLKGQVESAAAEKQQRESENETIAEQLVTWTAEREAAEARDRELQTESEQVRARIAEIEEELKTARQALDAARDRRGELHASVARLQSDGEHMAETCVQELSVTRPDLMAIEELPRLTGDELAVADTEQKDMRTKLENMGPVNMMALEEYKETAQRHEFLETQRKDLLDSIENTQNTIKEIDQITKVKFDEAFAAINENFGKAFKKLFGGGQGFMKLTDELNSSDSGIDVIASPPGKKLQNVLLLSGGEKTLTAFSLLVGIFQYAPSPFCILDEVDAPLDETNVARFNELVKEMSMQTQFILITHSKRTMATAPVMYGVTMQEPGVSKIVSVRFGEEAARATA
ncbi:condensin subunit Smc [Candidatus Koribacter versatilis Ellin345]|uniref:Chromosome partition protein Smc n=1 Tax=Koribacter versatilis (strain Ellin345) TaxID=204669 RepID=SMC_KORVE|nr:chromosome segregation protein SMC [Candidatus Koribacter versatilis]Q1INB1.1 RecName: Full=Chromosome partition protein Smc [Candidatus Koribacter versatilis Ellin345]ABF41639.1 condensin subunit Smc [Candidatus Koribacter versatilis Ellin345]